MKTKKLLFFVLVFLISFCFCACTDDKIDNQSEIQELKENSPSFSVTVVDDNGDAVEGVVLQMRKDFGVPARTNLEGIAKFPMIVTDGYKLFVISCPDGYEYTEIAGIPIKSGTNEYTLKITKK